MARGKIRNELDAAVRRGLNSKAPLPSGKNVMWHGTDLTELQRQRRQARILGSQGGGGGTNGALKNAKTRNGPKSASAGRSSGT